MRKRFLLAIIILCILTLIGIRFFSPEDTRICDGDVIIKHGNPSAAGSGYFPFGKKPQDKCSGGKLLPQVLLVSQNTSMKIIADFVDNGVIPSIYTCDGDGYFPRLRIKDVPVDAKSLVLIVDDPDAPSGVWDHLLLANIPISEYDILTISQDTFDLGIMGQNSRGEQARGAPCPPSGTHRYRFKLYALSSMLEISSGFSKERLIELMGGKVVGQTQIIGLYTR